MATNPYVNKVVFGNSTVMDISDTDATPSEVLNGRKFYLGSGAPAVGTAIGGVPEEELRDTVGWTGKNLFDSSYVSQSKNGITFTVNPDKSITANGTASADTYIECAFNLKSGTYIFGGVTGGSYATYYIDYVNTDGQTLIVNINDGDKTVTLNSDVEIRAYLDIRSGYVASNLTFRPMVRKASISDDTYEPYHSSVDECKYNRSEANVLGAKNLLEYPYVDTTKTVNGVTFTDNGDGSITINGTATADAPFALVGSWASTATLLPAGNYKYTLGANVQGVHYFAVYNTTALSTDTEDVSAPNGISYVFIRVTNGATISNATIYPMLRLASDTDSTYAPYAKTNKQLTDGLSDVLITLSKSEYEALSSTAKNDPNKVYYVYDDVSDNGYYEVEQTVTSQVAAGGTIRIPASGTDSHIKTTSTVIFCTELKSSGVSYTYRSIAGSSGYVTVTMAETVPASTKVGLLVYN